MRSTYRREWQALLLSLAITLTVLMACSNRGFGLGDEGYYLAWIVDPAHYTASIHPFGILLHLPFVALGKSLVALRVFGIALLMTSGALLGWHLARYYEALGVLRGSVARTTVAGTLFSLSYYAFWVLTPSYNLLANAAGALILSGCLTWTTTDPLTGDQHDLRGAILIGFGGVLAFFGKPTFAAPMALGVLVLLLHTGMTRGWTIAIRRAVLTGALCLLPLFAVLEASVTTQGFIKSVRTGLPILDFGNSPAKLPAKTFGDLLLSPRIGFVALAGLAFTLVMARRPVPPRQLLTYLNLGLVALTVLDLFKIFLARYDVGPWAVIGMFVIAIALAVLSYGVACSSKPLATRAWLPLIVLLLLPFLTALGTANVLVHQIGMTLYPVLLAATVGARLMLPAGGARAMEIGAALFVPALLVWAGTVSYNQPTSAWRQNVAVTSPFSNDTLLLDPITARYVRGLAAIGRQSGLTPGTPVFDLTGEGPGTALSLGGSQMFFPWTSTAFPNARKLVDATWDSMTPDQRRRSWIVGPVTEPFRSSRSVGTILRWRQRYELAGRLLVQTGHHYVNVQVWKPKPAPEISAIKR